MATFSYLFSSQLTTCMYTVGQTLNSQINRSRTLLIRIIIDKCYKWPKTKGLLVDKPPPYLFHPMEIMIILRYHCQPPIRYYFGFGNTVYYHKYLEAMACYWKIGSGSKVIWWRQTRKFIREFGYFWRVLLVNWVC